MSSARLWFSVTAASMSMLLRSGMPASKSWKTSGRVMVLRAAWRFSSGRSTAPGRNAILILMKASLQSASRYLALRE
uniref:Putative secreted protein n=1 Tax=Ixodes ricinus TaxID=34613 RepID=A0A6B0U629_IXORI